jgi:hypothetical protein
VGCNISEIILSQHDVTPKEIDVLEGAVSDVQAVSDLDLTPAECYTTDIISYEQMPQSTPAPAQEDSDQLDVSLDNARVVAGQLSSK